MRGLLLMTFAFLTALSVTPSAMSAATIFVTPLSGVNEVPPNGSLGSGFSTVTLSGDTLTVNESFSGLTMPATGAHIHCCAPVGTNAGIAVPFTAFPNALSGTYNQSFDLTLPATYTAAFLAANGSASGAETALVNALNAGQTYANIHDATFPGGEIRGQLQPAPEPATMAMMLLGWITLLSASRWKAHSRTSATQS